MPGSQKGENYVRWSRFSDRAENVQENDDWQRLQGLLRLNFWLTNFV